MELEKAIEILTQWHKDLQHDKLPDYHDALRLGIEASEAYAQARRLGLPLRCERLPSETKD